MQNDKKETSHKNTNSDVDDDIKIEKPSYTYWKRDSDMNADHTGFQPQPTNEHPEHNTNKIGGAWNKAGTWEEKKLHKTQISLSTQYTGLFLYCPNNVFKVDNSLYK